MYWKPIETAPKDGTDVLVLLDCAGTLVAHIAHHNSPEEWENSGQYCGYDDQEEFVGWWSYTRGSVGCEKLEDYRTPKFWAPFNVPSDTPAT